MYIYTYTCRNIETHIKFLSYGLFDYMAGESDGQEHGE